MNPASQNARAAKQLHHRAAFFVVAALLLGILVTLPFALAGVVESLAASANPTYSIVGDHSTQAGTRTLLNLRMTSLDEWQRLMTIEVSGHRVCAQGCTGADRVHFISVPVAAETGEGLPPYATIMFPPSQKGVSQEIKLPVSGSAIRYPFDHYGLRLAVVVQRVLPDGGVQTLSPQEANGYLFLSVNGSIPRAVMDKPLPVELGQVPVDDPAYQYVAASQLTFSRPLYLQVLTVLLVLLVSAAAAYAVFMRPLSELVINSGALILGVWGIRAIVLGAIVPGFTVVDLSLMAIILFLLVAITWRALWFLHEQGNLSLLSRGQGHDYGRPPDDGRPATNDLVGGRERKTR